MYSDITDMSKQHNVCKLKVELSSSNSLGSQSTKAKYGHCQATSQHQILTSYVITSLWNNYANYVMRGLALSSDYLIEFSQPQIYNGTAHKNYLVS